jgi:preprotein translocase subunit YajC
VGSSGFLIFIVIMFVVMYFLAIRPQKRKQQAMQNMLSKLKPGDEVVTIGGMYGDVVEVDDDKVTVEIAEDVHVEFARRAIAQIISQDSGYDVPDDEEEPDTSAEHDEPDEEPDEPQPAREEKRWGVFGGRSR